MSIRHDPPVWHLRLARDDAAAAVREAVEHYRDVEAGLVYEPDLTFTRARRIHRRRRDALAAWLEAGYAPLRKAAS